MVYDPSLQVLAKSYNVDRRRARAPLVYKSKKL